MSLGVWDSLTLIWTWLTVVFLNLIQLSSSIRSLDSTMNVDTTTYDASYSRLVSSSNALPSFLVKRLFWKANGTTKIKAFILLVAKRKLNNMENLQKRIKESQIRHWIQIVVLCVGGRKGYRSPFLALQFYARLMDLAF